jgi:D-threo-aldose 1-dehydrogenase
MTNANEHGIKHTDARAIGGQQGEAMRFETRRVGQTALNVTAMGLGGATLGGNMEAVADADARMVVIDAYDSGIRYFDTAPFYGFGRSEHMVGDGLRDRDGLVLSTKVGRLLKPRRDAQAAVYDWKRPFPFEGSFDYSYDAIMRSYEDSLQRLGLNRVDILYIHSLDSYDQGSVENRDKAFRVAMDESYKALDKLRASGEIKAIGLGINEAEPIKDAMQHGQWDVFLLAGRYTLLEQAPLHTVFPEIEKHGASIVIGGPFNSGILVGGETFNYTKAPPEVVTRVKAIARVCAAHNVPLAAAALQFPLANELVASVIPGPRSAEELNQIFDWWQTKIPAALWRDLKAEKVLDADAPVPT